MLHIDAEGVVTVERAGEPLTRVLADLDGAGVADLLAALEGTFGPMDTWTIDQDPAAPDQLTITTATDRVGPGLDMLVTADRDPSGVLLGGRYHLTASGTGHPVTPVGGGATTAQG